MTKSQRTKSISEFTKKDWTRFVPALAFFGIFMSGMGVYARNKEAIIFGVILVVVSILAGFVLHFFFGMKIIDLRRDFKHRKF